LANGVPPHWHNYKAEKGRTLGRAYGIKEWFYWEHIDEQIENTMGT
jgi:pyridoxine/pyridoxamine 5'-phosphate oxidase